MLVVFRKIKPVMEEVMSLAITGLFWALVGAFWLVIKGFGKIPLVINVMMAMFIVGLVVIGLFLLIVISIIVEER